MDNAIGLITSYQSKAKGKKFYYSQKKGISKASKLYGIDLAPQDKCVTAQIKKN